ncbi:MAG: hypothetical protein ACUVWX_11760 [Kiritimatiellia bacterium]
MKRLLARMCFGFALAMFLAGCEEEEPLVYVPTARDFGVTDPNRAALVLFDASDHYDIGRIVLIREDGTEVSLAPVPHDGKRVYELTPGSYGLTVQWKAQAGDPPRYMCRGVYAKRFALWNQDVQIYTLSGGTPCGHRIVPPAVQ